MENKKKIGMSLRTRLTILICILMAILGLVVCAASYMIFYDRYIGYCEQKGQEVACIAANTIDGDLMQEYIDGRPLDEEYEKMKASLENIAHNMPDLAYIYAMQPHDGYFTYLIDASPEPDSFGNNYEYGSIEKIMYQDSLKKQRSAQGYFGEDNGYGRPISTWYPVLNSRGDLVCMVEVDTILEHVYAHLREYLMMTIGLLAVLFAFFIGATVAVVRRAVTTPLENLTTYVNSFENGSFTGETFSHPRQDEIKMLSESFQDMWGKMQDYTNELTKVTAEKERIGTELNVATNIQASMLPCIFPAFPSRSEFDLYASMKPAKEVGGDFYDFFMVDDNHLAMVMADVSGKGVPAALFMVISKTMLKNRMQMGGTPGEVLAYVNNQLCETNSANMFVTVWLAVMEISTGHVIASSAGHEYPAVRKAVVPASLVFPENAAKCEQLADGRLRIGEDFMLLKDPHGFVLGAMDGMPYSDYEFDLEPGGIVFTYTDGIPESINPQEEQFEMSRMVDALNEKAADLPENLLKRVTDSVVTFANGADQFDDMTMFALKRAE